MGLKKFNELVKLDLTKFTQKKPTFYKDNSGKLVKTSQDKWLDYIEWAKVLELLYENGAENVSFFSELSKEKPNTLTVHLFIDDIERVIDYPIIDGNTILTNPNQLQLHKVELRGFVKCVAIHTGLGLSLWMKEENQLMETVEKKQDLITLPPLSDDRWNVAVQKIKSGEITLESVEKNYKLTQKQLSCL